MQLRSFPPSAALEAFVDAIWVVSNKGAMPSWQCIVPSGAMELVIHLQGRKLSFIHEGRHQQIGAPLLAGAYSSSFLLDSAELDDVLGVRFRPGCARAFFPLPAGQLHNRDVALGDLYPREADRLLDQLVCARGAERKVSVMERFLLGRKASGKELHPAVQYAVRAFQGPARAIAEVRGETGLSHTRFIDVFREHVGLTPKVFCRVQRFRTAVQKLEKRQPVQWAELAADCGYFDQAHLIRDFQAFSGMTPLKFVQYAGAMREPH
jgi:AraC-like DNA-binding protein